VAEKLGVTVRWLGRRAVTRHRVAHPAIASSVRSTSAGVEVLEHRGPDRLVERLVERGIGGILAPGHIVSADVAR
jgi:hypothetical protein